MSNRSQEQASEISRSFGQFSDSPLIVLAKKELSYGEREAFKVEAQKINEASKLWSILSYVSGGSTVISLCLGHGGLSAIFGAATAGAVGFLVHTSYVKSGELHNRLCDRLGVQQEPK